MTVSFRSRYSRKIQPRIEYTTRTNIPKTYKNINNNPYLLFFIFQVNFKWTFNNSADSAPVSPNRTTKSGTSSVVAYIPRTDLDYGTLLCYASNSIGTQRVPCVFHIIAAGKYGNLFFSTASKCLLHLSNMSL